MSTVTKIHRIPNFGREFSGTSFTAAWNGGKAQLAIENVYDGTATVQDAMLILEMQYKTTNNRALRARMAKQYEAVQRPDAIITPRLTRRYVEFDVDLDLNQTLEWRNQLLAELGYARRRKARRIRGYIASLGDDLARNGILV